MQTLKWAVNDYWGKELTFFRAAGKFSTVLLTPQATMSDPEGHMHWGKTGEMQWEGERRAET